MGSELYLAKKYAQAFLHCFEDQLSLEDFKAICSAGTFFSRRRSSLIFLRVSIVDNEAKKQMLQAMLAMFNVGKHFVTLIDLLLEHKRTLLLPLIFSYICLLYKRQKHIEVYSISSSHPLHSDELKILQRFLAKMTGNTIIYKENIDSSLIAGIRMQSDEHAWEHSIRKQLEDTKVSLIRKGI